MKKVYKINPAIEEKYLPVKALTQAQLKEKHEEGATGRFGVPLVVIEEVTSTAKEEKAK